MKWVSFHVGVGYLVVVSTFFIICLIFFFFGSFWISNKELALFNISVKHDLKKKDEDW